MNEFLNALKWRYATKKFDATKKIEASDIALLKEAMQLSASSYGLQPYKIFIIADAAIKKQLKDAAWGQQQVEDASHLIVIANQSDFDDTLVDSFVDTLAHTRGITNESLEGMATFMKDKLVNLPQPVKHQWTTNQAYIVLANLLSAAAHLKIDVCPMEGFDNKKFNTILGLSEQNLNAAVIAAVGYRSDEDQAQHLTKVRRPEEELFVTL